MFAACKTHISFVSLAHQIAPNLHNKCLLYVCKYMRVNIHAYINMYLSVCITKYNARIAGRCYCCAQCARNYALNSHLMFCQL